MCCEGPQRRTKRGSGFLLRVLPLYLLCMLKLFRLHALHISVRLSTFGQVKLSYLSEISCLGIFVSNLQSIAAKSKEDTSFRNFLTWEAFYLGDPCSVMFAFHSTFIIQ